MISLLLMVAGLSRFGLASAPSASFWAISRTGGPSDPSPTASAWMRPKVRDRGASYGISDRSIVLGDRLSNDTLASPPCRSSRSQSPRVLRGRSHAPWEGPGFTRNRTDAPQGLVARARNPRFRSLGKRDSVSDGRPWLSRIERSSLHQRPGAASIAGLAQAFPDATGASAAP